jgi:hypothetical protein
MTLRRPARSLLFFLGFVVALATVLGHLWDGLGVAAFFLFVSSIEAKPAWKWFYDAPGNQDSGRDGARFFSWRRVLPQSPQEQRRMPPLG